MWFVNQVAEQVEKTYPDRLIDTLAYQFTEAPPTGITPRKNVRIRLCPISVCQSHAYEECTRPENVAFIARLRGWSKLTDELYIWHYSVNFQHYLSPFPDLNQVASSLHLYKRSGVRGVMFQGGYSSPGSSEAELRSYVMAKLLWDVNADADALATEWMQGVYGDAAAVPMRRWYDLLARQTHDPAKHFFSGGTNWVDYVKPDVLVEGAKLFDKAERLTAGDEFASKQVAKARLGLRYAQLVVKPTKGPELDRFVEDVRKMGIGQLNEMTDVAGWEREYRAKTP